MATLIAWYKDTECAPNDRLTMIRFVLSTTTSTLKSGGKLLILRDLFEKFYLRQPVLFQSPSLSDLFLRLLNLKVDQIFTAGLD